MTPEQQKLVKQVILLKCLIEDFRLWTSDIPSNVYLKLSGTNTLQVDDPKQSIVSDMFSFMFEHVADIDFPGSSIVGKILGGMVDVYKQTNDKNPNDLPPDLREICADLGTRLGKTLKQLNNDLSAIESDPASHWNDTFKIPFGDDRLIVVNQLNDYTIPDKDDPSTVIEYNRIVDEFIAQMTNRVVKQAVSSNRMYKIGVSEAVNYLVGDFQFLIKNPESMPDGKDDGGEIEINLITGIPVWPFQIGKQPGDKYDHQAIPNKIGKKNGAKLEWMYASSVVDNPANESDFLKLVVDHLKNVAPFTYFLTTKKDDYIVYRRFFLITGDSHYDTYEGWNHEPVWMGASESLCNYLFKDDGFGNIINSDGIATRKEVFEQWGLEGSSGVVPFIMIPQAS